MFHRGSKSGDLLGRHTAEVDHDRAVPRWERRRSLLQTVVFMAGVVLAIHEDIGFADLEEYAVRQGKGWTFKDFAINLEKLFLELFALF